MPHWIDIVVKLSPAFFALVIGVVGSTIAYLQYRLSHQKLRFDLFTKRLEAYEKLQEFHTSVLREGTVVDSALSILAEARYKSRFLFGPEIERNLEKTWTKAIEMRTNRVRLHEPGSFPAGPERTALCEGDSELLQWMTNQIVELPKIYERYLQFK